MDSRKYVLYIEENTFLLRESVTIYSESLPSTNPRNTTVLSRKGKRGREREREGERRKEREREGKRGRE